jgi:hypothetical protein
MGVLLYYIAAWAAKKAVDWPVQFFRGIDMNHPYRRVVSGKAQSASGFSPKKFEYHKLYENKMLYKSNFNSTQHPLIITMMICSLFSAYSTDTRTNVTIFHNN